MKRTLIIENGCDLEADYPSYSAIALDEQTQKFITDRIALVKRLQETDKSLRRMTFDFSRYGFAFDFADDAPSLLLPPRVGDGENFFTRTHWVVAADLESKEIIEGATAAPLDVFNIVIDEDSFFIRASGHHDDFYFESRAVQDTVFGETPIPAAYA